jgi:uncharacterized protein (TIGR02246 family)
MKFSMIILAATFLLISSCKPATEAPAAEAPKPDMDAVKAEIQALENAWAAASNAKDLATLMSMYAEDAISMVNDAPSQVGKAAIQASISEDFASAPEGMTSVFTTQEVFGDDNIVTEIGTGVHTYSADSVRTGKYVAIWKKIDGKFLCIREIFNNDAPTK